MVKGIPYAFRPEEATPADAVSLAITRISAATVAWLIGVADALAERDTAVEDMVGEVTGVLEDTREDEATGLELGWLVAGLDTGVDEDPTGVEELAGLELTGAEELTGVEIPGADELAGDELAGAEEEIGFEVGLPLGVALGEVAELTGVLPGLELGELTGELEEEPAGEEFEDAGLEELGTEVEVAKVDGTAELEGETVSIEETMPLDPEDKEDDEN